MALNQEYIELDLFHYGLARFSEQEFLDAGLAAEYRFLIEYMADQEVGHAEMITNLLYRTFGYCCPLPRVDFGNSARCETVQVPISL